MNTTGELLERVGERFPFPDDAFDRMRRRHDRRRRNQRLVTAAVALVLAIAAIGGAIEVFRADEGRTPASPSITIRNIGDLQIAWTATNGGRWINEPVVSNGMVYEVANATLFAYPTDCIALDGRCAATWIAPLPGKARLGAAIVDSGHVFVMRNRTLYAFAASCGSNGETCPPLWTARFPTAFRGEPHVAAATAGAVYVTAAGDLYAVSEDCASGAATCHAERLRRAAPYGGYVVVADGVVVVVNDRADGVVAIPAGCVLPSTCAPIWRWSSPGGLSSIQLDRSGGGWVFVELKADPNPSDGVTLYALDTGCGAGGATCTPSWTVQGCCPSSVIDGVVFVRANGGMAAFSTACATDGSTCSPLYRFAGGHGYAQVSPDGSFVYETGIKNGTIRAWSTAACANEQPPGCNALWRAHKADWVGGLEPLAGGLLARWYGGSVHAYPNDCGTNGALCEPMWSADSLIDGRAGLPVMAEGMMFIQTDGRLVALAPGHRTTAGATNAESFSAWIGLIAAAFLGLALLVVRRIRASRDRGAGGAYM